MDTLAQEVIDELGEIMGEFGIQGTVKRTVQAETPTRNVFGTPTNATVETFDVKIVVESQKINTLPTLAGGKAKEELRLIIQAGQVENNDEITFSGHTYKVVFVQPVPVAGTDVVNFAHAEREVD